MDRKCELQNQIQYSGNLDIILQKNGARGMSYSVKNSGTDFLITSLAKALCGYSVAESVPSYIRWVDSANKSILLNSEGSSVSGLKYNEPALNQPSSFASVEVVSVIRKQDVQGYSQNPTQFILTGADTSKELARLNIDADSSSVLYKAISEGSECLLRWTLKIVIA